MQRSFQKRKPKLEGRGVLEHISTDGPHSDWLGMPDYYIHTLTVAGEEYKYLAAEKTLDVQRRRYCCVPLQGTGQGKAY